MATYICAHCGATFTSHDEYAAHYGAEHPDQPFPLVRDGAEEEAEDATATGLETDRPVNVIEETMEESPEDTPEGDAFG